MTQGRAVWSISLWMMFCSFLSYLDRQALAVLSPSILAETHMTAEAYGRVVAGFSVAYMLGNPIWGSLLDRFGLRLGMTAAVALWTVASAAHAGMADFAGFVLCRTLLGFGEGATFPGGLRAAMDSLPPNRTARGIALAYSGGSLGAILTPLLVVPVAAAWGWRAAFLVTGVLGAAWIAGWLRLARPPYLPQKDSPRAARFTWPDPRERRFWSLVASYSLGAAALGPILYLAPLYLGRVHGLSQSELGRVLWIPPLGWEVGYFFWGWVTDRFAPGRPRPVWLFVLLAALALPFAATPSVPSPAGVLALMWLAMFAASGFVVASLRSAAVLYPREQTSLVAGIGAGSWSALVAVLLPVLGRWFDDARFADTFVLLAVLPAAGTTAWILLSRGLAATSPPAE
ncbi:MAG: MFS transporter [Bryobacteraceae bacterium]|nr:MFS transporter [Bryobacteraceae bacterium]